MSSLHRSIHRSIHRGINGGGGTPATCWPDPLEPCSIDTTRYLWLMDGQSMFWLRSAVWECVDPTIKISFIGRTTANTYMLFDGDTSGTDRAFAYINGNSGFVNSPSAESIKLNNVLVDSNTAKPIEGKENLLEVSFKGSFKMKVVGCRFMIDTAFCPTPVTGISLIDPASEENSHTTKFKDNLNYQLELGGTSENSTTFYRENEEADGSGIALISRKKENSGWEDVNSIWEPNTIGITGKATTTGPDSFVVFETGEDLAGVISPEPISGSLIGVTGNLRLTSGQLDVSVKENLAGVELSLTESGDFSFEVISLGYLGFKRSFASGAEATVTNLRVRTIRDFAAGSLPNN